MDNVFSLPFQPVKMLAALKTLCDSVIAAGPPQQVIDRVGEVPYIERWMLSRKAEVPCAGDPMFASTMIPSFVENIYVHRYGRADLEDMHDHPWDNASLIVHGWYKEETPEGVFTRKVGDVVLRKAEDQHKILDVLPGTITLFGTLPKRREWGFWENGAFTHWKEWEKRQPMPV